MAEEEKLLPKKEVPELAQTEEILELPEGLEKELAEEKEKAAKYLDNWQRSEADFSNYRKRIEQEKEDNLESVLSKEVIDTAIASSLEFMKTLGESEPQTSSCCIL